MLDHSLTGQLWLAGDEGFEEAACGRVFNHRRPARRPAAVLRPSDAAAVAAGVRFARRQGWQVAVRAGGHSWAAWGLRDDALLIDLAYLNSIEIDPAAGVARVGPAVRGGLDLDPALAEHGLFFAGGHCATVGLGGFLLQGGMGWNCRGWGWAAESVVGIEVVTASGAVVYADEGHHPELLWAARGSGPGFFGVVTSFTLRLRPRPTGLHRTIQVYDADATADVLGWLYETQASVGPDVELVAVGGDDPSGDRRVLTVAGLAFGDDEATARAQLAPLETCPSLPQAIVREVAAPTTFGVERAEQIRANPEGHRYAVDNAWLTSDGPGDELITALTPAFARRPTPQTFSLWYSMAPLRPLPDMCLSLQTEIYFASYVIWADPTLDPSARAWLAARMADLEPWTAGQYLGDSDLSTRKVRFLSDAAYGRLEALRRVWDPDSVFAGYLHAGATPLNANHWDVAI